ncbi:MAG: DUF6544 family protein [Bacillota bacterium]|nr:DUF6544 family protein [Bacillota bacterium]MDW7683557.1 DUF6544 family protein [Bacillota bacterium]
MTVLMWIIRILLVAAIIVVIAVSAGRMLFDRQVRNEVQTLFQGIPTESNMITEEDLVGLPEPVQRWLQRSQVVGKEKATALRLKQKGLFRMGEDKPWIPFTAQQYYNIESPGFIWYTTMKMAPSLSVRGRDLYYDGRGNMLIKVLSLIKVADASGLEMDQGTLVRFLNEMMWFPSAAINDYVTWEQVSENSAKAMMEYKGVSASAIFHFNDDGDLINFVAERYMDSPDGFRLETWATPIDEHREMDGRRIPTKGEAIWELDTGDFSYIQLEVTEIEYNNPTLY